MISLYVHVPFCTKKCPYCHFYVIPNRLPFRTLLQEGLDLEWTRQAPLFAHQPITSLYFGGGTPTLFGPAALEAFIQKAKPQLEEDCEITIEANPEESTLEMFQALRAIGINRLSLGVQSLDDRSLQTLERTHSAKKAKEAIFAAEKAGFTNVSIDLMYDLPDQSEESWRYTLSQLTDLPIHHLSLYNLTVEPHTAFQKRGVKPLEGKRSLKLLLMALEALEKRGFERYEISAFAKDKKYSRHNLGYWTARPFLGFGPSAFSYWEGKRFQNISNIQRYVKRLREGISPIDFQEELSQEAGLKERLAVRLRLKEGADLHLFSPLPKEVTEAIERLIKQGLLQKNESVLQLTEQGMLFYDLVASELI